MTVDALLRRLLEWREVHGLTQQQVTEQLAVPHLALEAPRVRPQCRHGVHVGARRVARQPRYRKLIRVPCPSSFHRSAKIPPSRPLASPRSLNQCWSRRQRRHGAQTGSRPGAAEVAGAAAPGWLSGTGVPAPHAAVPAQDQAVLDLGGRLEVVVPAEVRDRLPAEFHERYDALFRSVPLPRSSGSTTSSPWGTDSRRGYGGTADVVNLAREGGLPVDRIWPAGARQTDATGAPSCPVCVTPVRPGRLVRRAPSRPSGRLS